ncbi:MAG: hypothetical protein ACRC1K_26355, partial [Planctomycetia bacterium]
FDMHGNVYELCHNVSNETSSPNAPLCGGCWLDPPEKCTASTRFLAAVTHQCSFGGFRIGRFRKKPTEPTPPP